jgi:uncharacterized membrane protein
MFNNSPSAENEQILAALAYFPFISLLIVFKQFRKHYFIKYHAIHAIILYLISLFVLLSYVSIYVILRGFIDDTTTLDLLWGLLFSLHILVFSIYLFYCSIQTYQGKYLIIPGVTRLYYLIFKS